MLAVRPEPVRGPVERAEIRARGHVRIRGGEDALADAVGDERADAALVPVALGDDERPEATGEGIHLEVRGRALDVVQQAEDVRLRKLPQAVDERTGSSPGLRQRFREPPQRPVLAEVQELVLSAEVVIEISRRQIRGIGDVAHPRGREAAGAEHAGGGLQDPEAPFVGPS